MSDAPARHDINQQLVEELSAFEAPDQLIAELVRRFGARVAIGTSGQLSGVAMIDMAVRAGVKPRVFTIDTLRLFPETYELFDQIEQRYGLKVERIKPDSAKLDKMIAQHGENLFFDSKAKQEYCCMIRKVEPNEQVLNTLDVWISGLRREQSSFRAETPRFEMLQHGADPRPLLKVAPLVDWTEQQLRDYIKEYDVPMHKLLSWEQDGWRYESLGCMICTTPIGPQEGRRAGRWRWFNGKGDEEDNKECGIHGATKPASNNS